MNNKTIYDFLDNNPDNNQNRLALINYLKNNIQSLGDNEKYSETVYNMAGMMSANYVHSLPDDDILMQILTLAGELEVEDENTNENLNHLIYLINQL